jgi:hypothetical protein
MAPHRATLLLTWPPTDCREPVNSMNLDVWLQLGGAWPNAQRAHGKRYAHAARG